MVENENLNAVLSTWVPSEPPTVMYSSAALERLTKQWPDLGPGKFGPALHVSVSGL